MSQKDFYELLEVSRDASSEEIKRAFRTLARKYHPDAHNVDASEELFQLVTEAYDTLSDSTKREAYDEAHGFIKKQATTTQVFGTPTWEEDSAQEKASKKKESEPQNSLWGKVSRVFQRGVEEDDDESGPGPSGGFDLRGERIYNFTIDALESIQGTTRELALPAKPSPRLIRVRIPAAVPNGAIIRIRCPATDGGEEEVIRGRVNIIPHEFVERSENDLTLQVPITIGESLCGGSLEIPTLEGPMRVQLPPRWNIEQRLRVRGKGIRAQDGTVGDLYVRFVILPPESAPPSVEQFAKELDRGYSKPVRGKLPSSLK